jgi:hypothetical protein
VFRFVFLAALALPAAAGEQEIRTPSCTAANLSLLSAELPAHVKRVLARDPKQGAAAARYLSGHADKPLRLAVARTQAAEFPGIAVMYPGTSDVYGAYHNPYDDGIYVNHSVVHFRGQNESSLLRDPERLERAIQDVAPLIVHEVSHARDDLGSSSHVNTLETELVAFYRQMFYTLDTLDLEGRGDKLRNALEVVREHETLKRRMRLVDEEAARRRVKPVYPPELLAANSRHNLRSKGVTRAELTDVDLLVEFSAGNARFEKSIASLYPLRSAILTEAGWRREKARVAELLPRFKNSDAELLKCGPGATPERRRACDADGDTPAAVAEAQDTLRVVRGQAADMAKPAKLATIRKHYANTLAALRKEAKERREANADVLRAFAPL